MKLDIELVPHGAWFQNLRSMMSTEQWDYLRRDTYERVGYRCEICGGKGLEHPVECHEKWHYDDVNKVSELVGLYGLCPACHECKHMGLAQMRGNLPRARAHFATVNGLTLDEADTEIRKAFRIWRRRSKFKWKVKVSVKWAYAQGGKR